MYHIYVLLSLKDKTLYKGITNNLSRRIRQHNDGKCQSTIHRRPLKLVYHETASNQNVAREREKYLKSGSGREFLRELINYLAAS